jgi:hypothetical protein
MQGPVGFRCKKCGTLAYDPLTTMRPTQIALGTMVAIGGGAVAGLISGLIGFFGIFIAFFAGGIIAEAVTRVTGYKRGPVMLGVVLGGITVGTIIGAAAQYAFYASQFSAVQGAENLGVGLGSLILASLPWIAIAAGAACFGAYSRLR